MRLALIIAFLVPALFFGLHARQSYQQALDEAHEQVEQAVGMAREHALLTFEINEVMAGRVRDLLHEESENSGIESYDREPYERERRLHARLKDIAATIPQVQSIWVWNNDGRPLVSTSYFPVPDHLSVADQDYFEAQKRPGLGIFISELDRQRYGNETYFHISRRREAKDGRFMGIISIGLATRGFSEHYRETAGKTVTLDLSLARADGLILAHYPHSPTPGTRLQFRPAPADVMGNQVLLRPVMKDDTIGARSEWISLQRKIGTLPLYVEAGMTRAAALATWESGLLRPAFLCLLVAAALAALTWLAFQSALRGHFLMLRVREEENRCKAAESALRQSRKLEAIGQLTGGVAHDFNNLLMIVSTNLHILKLKTTSLAVERELAAIGRAVTNGQSLTRQLMAFSRRQATLQLEIIDLGERMPLICDLIKHSLRPGITLQCKVAPHTWPVKVDASELELALLNLAVNARDAMPDGGAITIQVGNLHLDGSLNPVDALSGEFVGILVQDTGHGVPTELIERVFEPFFTTKEVGKGTGLGLSQVYGFAKQSGGTAMIDNHAPQGASVTIFLPRAPQTVPACATTRGLILVAEANPEVGRSIAALLEQLGYCVQLKHEPLEVLEALTGGNSFDLLLADVAMPGGMSGIELVRVVAVRFPKLPVILMTGYGDADPRVVDQGLAVLTKPFDVNALTRALEAKLGRAHAALMESAETRPA